MPTLLSRIPPDCDAGGWNVIDRATWDRLAPSLGLSDEARLDLVSIVVQARSKARSRKRGLPKPGVSRKELRRLHRLASKLVDGLRALDDCSLSAVTMALCDEQQYKQQFKDIPLLSYVRTPRLGESGPLEREIENVETWRERLSRAGEIAEPWQADAGGDRSLRRLVNELDEFLIRHTDKGLVRASEATKRGGSGRATACCEFVSEICRLIFRPAPPEATIDDAIKDAINSRRSVGKS